MRLLGCLCWLKDQFLKGFKEKVNMFFYFKYIFVNACFSVINFVRL